MERVSSVIAWVQSRSMPPFTRPRLFVFFIACSLVSIEGAPEIRRRGDGFKNTMTLVRRRIGVFPSLPAPSNPITLVRRRIGAPPASVSETTTTHLRQVTQSFENVLQSYYRHSKQGLSIPMEPLLEACRVFSDVLRQTGPKAVASNFADNLQKAERLLSYKPSKRTRDVSCMKSLLQTERDQGVHQRECHVSDEHATVSLALKDPSGAMGLLWIRRSLEFQSDWYEGIVKGMDPKASALSAYQNTLRPYHGWALQKLYATFLSANLPKQRQSVLAKFVGDEKEQLDSEEQEQVILDDLQRLVDLWRPLLNKWEQSFVELGLEDKRQV